MKQTLRELAENRAESLGNQMARVISEEFLKPLLASHSAVNLNDPDTIRKLDELILTHFKNQNINRVVLYDENSIITYSTRHTIIGYDASLNAGVQAALDDRISSHIIENVEFDDLDPGSKGLRGRLIETYIPFSFNVSGQSVKGVVEIYQNLRQDEERIKSLNRNLLVLVVILLVLLFLILFVSVIYIEKKWLK